MYKFTECSKLARLAVQEQPRLPTPLGHFVYSKFLRLPLADRLTALPLVAAAADFDGSPDSWRRYDGMSARELFRRCGISERLYRDAFEPMLLVGLFAPGDCLGTPGWSTVMTAGVANLPT